MTANASPATSTRKPGTELRDGDLVYITGRWQVLTDVRPEGDRNFRASTERGSLIGRSTSQYDVATR